MPKRGIDLPSFDLISAAIELKRIKRHEKTSRQHLKDLVRGLAERGLDDLTTFRTRLMESLVHWDYLKGREGKVFWEQPQNRTIEKVFAGIHQEFLNLKNLADGERGDIDRALEWCLWLHLRALVATSRRPRRLAA